jgi:hypothetical protein
LPSAVAGRPDGAISIEEFIASEDEWLSEGLASRAANPAEAVLWYIENIPPRHRSVINDFFLRQAIGWAREHRMDLVPRCYPPNPTEIRVEACHEVMAQWQLTGFAPPDPSLIPISIKTER